MWSNHAEYIDIAQFDHMEPMYQFKLNQFNEIFEHVYLKYLPNYSHLIFTLRSTRSTYYSVRVKVLLDKINKLLTNQI